MIYPVLLIFTDFIALVAAFTLAYILRVQVSDSPLVREIAAVAFIKVFVLLFPFWLMVNGMLGLYRKPVYEKRLPEMGRIFVGSIIGIMIIITFDFVREETIFPARLVPVYGFLLAFTFLTLFRNILWLFRRYMFRYGYGVRGVMIIGTTHATKELVKSLRHTLNSGYKIRAIVGNKTLLPKGYDGKHFSTIEQALDELPKMAIHTIIQTEFYENEKRNERIFAAVRNNHLQYKFIPAHSDFYTGKNTVEILFGFPVISVHQTPLMGWGRVIKRITDVVLTLVVLVVAIPIMALVALVMKIKEPRAPLFYQQRRMTRYGTEFGIYKFRSMQWKYCTGPKAPFKTNEEAFVAMGREDLLPELAKYSKVADDPRVTKIGKFLRASSIDELPQLLNVLKGELSLVGPRAMTAAEAKMFNERSSGDVILSVKGGITGLWQVSGRSEITFDERMNLELYYVQNWSLWMDIKILFKTVYVVIKKTGAN
jgi:exopolysaccharide biosynthesis polyprenyl glycosylphosphotransferase